MQAGARHYQWLSGKLADNEFSSENRLTFPNFLSGQRAENTSFGGSPCRVGAEAAQCWLHLVTALCTKSFLGASPSKSFSPAASPNPWNHTSHPTDIPRSASQGQQPLCRLQGLSKLPQIKSDPFLCRALSTPESP